MGGAREREKDKDDGGEGEGLQKTTIDPQAPPSPYVLQVHTFNGLSIISTNVAIKSTVPPRITLGWSNIKRCKSSKTNNSDEEAGGGGGRRRWIVTPPHPFAPCCTSPRKHAPPVGGERKRDGNEEAKGGGCSRVGGVGGPRRGRGWRACRTDLSLFSLSLFLSLLFHLSLSLVRHANRGCRCRRGSLPFQLTPLSPARMQGHADAEGAIADSTCICPLSRWHTEAHSCAWPVMGQDRRLHLRHPSGPLSPHLPLSPLLLVMSIATFGADQSSTTFPTHHHWSDAS